MAGRYFTFPVDPRPRAEDGGSWRGLLVVVLTVVSAINAWRGAERDADVEQRLRNLHHWSYDLQGDVDTLRHERDALAHRVALLEGCRE